MVSVQPPLTDWLPNIPSHTAPSLTSLNPPSTDCQDIPSYTPPCHESSLPERWYLNHSQCKAPPLTSVNPSYTVKLLPHPDLPASPQSILPSLGNSNLSLKHRFLFVLSQSCLQSDSQTKWPLLQLWVTDPINSPFNLTAHSPLYHSLKRTNLSKTTS